MTKFEGRAYTGIMITLARTIRYLLTAEYTSWIRKRRGPASSSGYGNAGCRQRRKRRRSVAALPPDVTARQEATNFTKVDTRKVAVHRHLLTSDFPCIRDVIIHFRLYA